MLTLCLSQSLQAYNWPGIELTNIAREKIFISCRISNENVVKSDVGAWFLFLSVGDIFFNSGYIEAFVDFFHLFPRVKREGTSNKADISSSSAMAMRLCIYKQ